ncbi:MAG: cytochrome C oxidase subunit IV family protein [Planctomycetota bacterium]
MTESHSATHDDHGNDWVGYAHVMPVYVLVGVFVILIVLTWLTVAATWFDLGVWNLWIAMAIATVKAGLVAAYFMHLRYDNKFNALLMATALVFVFLFISVTMMDALGYQHDIKQFREKAEQDMGQ